jgi:hypothetical protein
LCCTALIQISQNQGDALLRLLLTFAIHNPLRLSRRKSEIINLTLAFNGSHLLLIYNEEINESDENNKTLLDTNENSSERNMELLVTCSASLLNLKHIA